MNLTKPACGRGLADLAHPGFYVSHNLGLDDAPEAYRCFDNRDQG